MEGSGLEKSSTNREYVMYRSLQNLREGCPCEAKESSAVKQLVALVREVKYKSQAIVNNVLGQTFVAQVTTFTELYGRLGAIPCAIQDAVRNSGKTNRSCMGKAP